MSAKIERIGPAGAFLPSAVKRRESPERDGSSDQKYHEERESKDSDDDEAKEHVDRASVEKAMDDLRASGGFERTGMKVEVLNSKDGMRVRLARATGEVVKVMTAEEFLKLRTSSEDGDVPRGKILDQKV